MSDENTNTPIEEPIQEDPEPTPTPPSPDSILNSVKRVLGLTPEYTPFDEEIIMDINTILGIVNQLGAGKIGFTIQDSTATWADFLERETAKGITVNEVKTYVAKRVQMIFDPPTSGIYMDALKENVRELESRILYNIETPLHYSDLEPEPDPEIDDADEDP